MDTDTGQLEQMKCKKVAIIAFFHTEASLCLSKYIAKQGVDTDCYLITDLLHDKGSMPGINYQKVRRRIGLTFLTDNDAPEIVKDSVGVPVKYYLLRLFSFHKRFYCINNLILKSSLRTIKKKKYDAINIIGQWPLVEIIHDELNGENLIHTFHEIGSHQDGVGTTPLLNKVIRDKSKIILLSKSTHERFCAIPESASCSTAMIPMGLFYTLLLYQRDVTLNINLDEGWPTFLFYGYLRPYKGLDVLAKACVMLERDNVFFNLIIAGAGSDDNLDYFKSRQNCTVINRFLTDEEMMLLNRKADVVLLPYKTASQSGIVCTSFLFGNPIIATKVGALPETIIDRHNGLLVEPNDPIGFAEAMKSLIMDYSFFNKLKEGASSFGHDDEFDWNNIAKKTLDFYGR